MFFQSDCVILDTHQYHMSVSVLLHSCKHLIGSVFLILDTLINVKLYLIVLICISPVTNDSEYLYAYLPSIYLLW